LGGITANSMLRIYSSVRCAGLKPNPQSLEKFKQLRLPACKYLPIVTIRFVTNCFVTGWFVTVFEFDNGLMECKQI
jgi:hypothetical protein